MKFKLIVTLLLTFVVPSMATCNAVEWNDVRSWVYLLTNYKDNELDELRASEFDLAVNEMTLPQTSPSF